MTELRLLAQARWSRCLAPWGSLVLFRVWNWIICSSCLVNLVVSARQVHKLMYSVQFLRLELM
jgi:hypothetical protein